MEESSYVQSCPIAKAGAIKEDVFFFVKPWSPFKQKPFKQAH